MRRCLLPALLLLALAPTASAATPRIVGGGDARAGDFPYVANIAIAGSLGCTGSLIAPQWVMTAGHCGSTTGEVIGTPAAFPASAYSVTLGTVAADGTGGETHTVSEVDIDPDYTGSNGNDVSLLKLDTPSKITPVLIAAKNERALWDVGKLETIAGFGTTKEDGDAPETMQVAQVPIVSDADCAKAYPPGLPILGNPPFEADSMVCAGYPQGGTDTCQGDSGGPLLAPLGMGTYRLVGATSYGQGCAEAGFPGVYARIADVKIRKFVEGVVPGAYAPEAKDTPAADPSPTPGASAAPTTTPAPAATTAPAKATPKCAHRARVTFGARARRVQVRFRGKTIYAARGAAIKRFRYALPRGEKATLRIVVVTRSRARRVFVRRYADCRLVSVKRHGG